MSSHILKKSPIALTYSRIVEGVNNLEMIIISIGYRAIKHRNLWISRHDSSCTAFDWDGLHVSPKGDNYQHRRFWEWCTYEWRQSLWETTVMKDHPLYWRTTLLTGHPAFQCNFFIFCHQKHHLLQCVDSYMHLPRSHAHLYPIRSYLNLQQKVYFLIYFVVPGLCLTE